METKDKVVKPDGYGPFQLAENAQGFAKVSLQGFAGGGKTLTASLIAKGLYDMIGAKKPIAFVDTEKGVDFVAPRFKEWGIPLITTRTRSFKALIDATKWSVGNVSILIIDSISSFWNEVQKTYRYQKVVNNLKKRGMSDAEIAAGIASGKYNKTNLTMKDWVELKEVWHDFTDLYLNSELHIIMCGRAKWEYDFVEQEDESTEIQKTGTSMMAEKELSFEPSLLIEMRHEPAPGQDSRTDAKFWQHVAYVLKDRSDTIDGKRFINPTFEEFKPHFQFLSIGGKNAPIESGEKDRALFARGSSENAFEVKQRIEILLEEIKGELVRRFPGRGDKEIALKQDILHKVFTTYSWTKISSLSIPELKKGLEVLRRVLAETPAQAEPEAKPAKDKKKETEVRE